MTKPIVCIYLPMVTALLIASCTPVPACPTVNPYGRSHGTANADINVDADLKRILGDPVSWGRVPKNMVWSPDGARFAYSRPGDDSLVSQDRLLWVFETDTLRERPLLKDPQPPVSEFEWLDPNTVVLLSEGAFLKVTTDGEVTPLGPVDHSNNSPIEQMRLSKDGSRVAFVRNCALEIMTLSDGAVTRVTSGTGRQCPGMVPAGYADAFHTRDGLGWSADGRYLWFYSINEAQPWTARIHIAQIDSAPPKITVLPAQNAEEYFPWVGFHPDGKRLCIIRMDRLQTKLSLEFCQRDGSACEAVLKESDPRWVNFLRPPRFYGVKNEFLWLSERTGMAHIFRHGPGGEAVEAITEGRYSVYDINHVSEDGQEIVFTADIGAPWTRSLYKRTAESNDLIPLSEQSGTHVASFSPDGAFWLDTHSSVNAPAVTDLMSRDKEQVSPVDQAMRRKYLAVDVVNILETIPLEEEVSLIAHWTRPEVIGTNDKFPTIVVIDPFVGDLTATDAFHGVFSAWRNHLARMGIIVVSVDGSGKRGQGKEQEFRIHRNPLAVVLDDQRRALELISGSPGVDPTRIGIIGRGLGATAALQMLLKQSKDRAFRFGIIVDPLPGLEYALEPTIERYMQRPEDNPEGYAAAEVLPLLSNLKNPLFIACGSDEGQPTFAATQEVITGFVRAGKMVDVACYARPIHSAMDEATRVHLYSRITQFIAEHI